VSSNLYYSRPISKVDIGKMNCFLFGEERWQKKNLYVINLT